jgi:hypothetical protein
MRNLYRYDMVGICAEGFCVPPEEGEEGGGGDENGKMMDDVAGTGEGLYKLHAVSCMHLHS